MKISDVHNRSNEAYPHADMKECVQLAVGAFGKERVMWGTGYPDTAHRVASGARLDTTESVAVPVVALLLLLVMLRFDAYDCMLIASICELRCFWLVLREAASCHARGWLLAEPPLLLLTQAGRRSRTSSRSLARPGTSRRTSSSGTWDGRRRSFSSRPAAARSSLCTAP